MYQERMSSRGSNDYYEDEYDSNAEFEGGYSPTNSMNSSLYSKRNPRNSMNSNTFKKSLSGSSSSDDVEILSYEEGVKKLFIQKKAKNNERFISGLLTRRATPNHPRIVRISLADKLVVKQKIETYVKKAYKDDEYIIKNISSILAGKITSKDSNTLKNIDNILKIYLEVSKQISLDRSVIKLSKTVKV